VDGEAPGDYRGRNPKVTLVDYITYSAGDDMNGELGMAIAAGAQVKYYLSDSANTSTAASTAPPPTTTPAPDPATLTLYEQWLLSLQPDPEPTEPVVPETTFSGIMFPNGWDPVAEKSYGPSSMGRGLTFYNASNGAGLWSTLGATGAPDSAMKYAFATEPTAVDIDGDGFTDLIYAVDVNAQIWRINVHNGANSFNELFTYGKLAELGSDSAYQRRRAYKAIDVSLISRGGENEVVLAIGTGDKMNPMSNTDQDRLFVIRDKTAYSTAPPTAVLTETDFYDATDNLIGEGSATQKVDAADALNAKSGWYINLPRGQQKSISAPLMFKGVVNFPVFRSGSASSEPCQEFTSGTGVLYRMNISDGTPIDDLNGDSSLNKDDRTLKLNTNSVPGDMTLHFSSEGNATLFSGIQGIEDIPADANPPRTDADPLQGNSAGYWFETPR